jgi:GntR family transcriptional regulator
MVDKAMVSSAKFASAGSNKGIALYVRLANVFRTEIRTGRWKSGAQLPTIPELVRQYGVGTVTVRQAFAVLADEGLIESFRGRGTFVNSGLRLLGLPHQSLRSVISDPLADHPELTIKVLRRKEVDRLPVELQGRHASDSPFMWVRKIHLYAGSPFALMDIYVKLDVYRRFPRNGERRFTIPRLISDYGNVSIAVNDIELSVQFADEESARLLDYTPAGALAKLRRWRTDPDNNVVMGSLNLFRADRFVLDIAETSPPFNINAIRPVKAKP